MTAERTLDFSEDEDPAVAGRDLRTEALLREWNIQFEYQPEFSLASLADKADADVTQVRHVAHRAPADTVAEFSTQMRAQIAHSGHPTYPPIVLTHNGRRIDGNTRIAAARHIGLATLPAYLVKLRSMDLGVILGAALNQMGGKRLSAEEAYEAAEKMMRDGYTDDAISRILGRSPAAVRQYRREQRYEDSAVRTGVEVLPVTKTVKRHLADVKHDAPFKELVELVATAKPSAKDVQELVGKVNEAHSEGEELEIIDQARGQWEVTGPPPRKVVANRVATDARRKAEQLLAIKATPAELAPAAQRDDLEPVWRRVYELSASVLMALEEAPAES